MDVAKRSIDEEEGNIETVTNVDKEELHRLLVPNIEDLPSPPPSSVDSNFVSYFAPDFMKEGHDQYIYRHPNGLCVIGLAPTHIAFRGDEPITAVDFNVGKSNRSEIKVTGKRKRNAQHFESNTALCKVFVKETSYIVRCVVKGSLLEVNDRLIKQPELLNSAGMHVEGFETDKTIYLFTTEDFLAGVLPWKCSKAEREGYIAIIMPKPADWLKVKESLLSVEDYKKLKDLST